MTSAFRPLTPNEVARLIESAAAAIRAELAAHPDDVLGWHPAPGEWCAKEVVGHLIESERRGFAGRIRRILAGDEPVLEAWDQTEVARARRDCERAAPALIAELDALRRDSAALVTGLRPADLTRGGRSPKVGRLQVSELLHEWVHHDRNHLRQMLANTQAAAWAQMGNAQRFTTG
ncbi:MAG TPA: DinB family protein [Casimicrobiaceae bacterium]|nr:DinB family protein [Casimicrobiaceae bacterium]